MNELSWMIYAADVAGSVKWMAGIGIVGTGLGVAISLGVSIRQAIEAPETNNHRSDAARWDEAMADHVKYPRLYDKPASDRPVEEEVEIKPWKAWPSIKKPVATLAGAVAVFCLFPSSGTIYAIAASEMGERVLTSETGGKAVQALDAWLDRQIAGKTEGQQ